MEQTEKMQVQERINALMAEYSRRKHAKESPRTLKTLKAEVYLLLVKQPDSSDKELQPCPELKSILEKNLDINKTSTVAYAPMDVILECFLKALDAYDAEKNPNFWAYFQVLIQNWIQDHIYKANTRVIGKNAEGKPIRQSRTISDAIENDNGEISTITETCPDKAPNPAEILELKENADAGAKAKLQALFSSVVGYYQHNQGKAANQEKLRYYRCFATDYIICFAKAQVFDTVSVNEQDAFAAMDCTFLDYLMTNVCRTLYRIEQTPLKTYEELSITKKSGVIRTPLEGIVYKDFLSKTYQKAITDAALSQQRKAFHFFLGIDKKTHTWNLPKNEEAKA